MKKILIIASIFSSFPLFAEEFKCVFTEPFISFTYNTKTEKLIEEDAVSERKRVLKNIKFQIKDAGTFLLKDSSDNLIASLSLTNNGSDGMSDTIYPYEAKFVKPSVFSMPIYGGCTSSLLDVQ